MSLTTHQEEKLNECLDILETSKRLLIKGSAGVGKTYMVDALIQSLLPTIPKYRKVYVSAPTNKAVSILAGKVTINASNIQLITTHSALKIGAYTDNKTGITKFIPMFSEKNPPLKECRIFIIDECSMIGVKMLEYIEEHATKNNCLVIFIGDDKQINPVAEEDSVVFNQDYPTVELIEIVRQGKGNSITHLSRNISEIWKYETRVTEDKQGFVYTFDEFKIIDELAKVNGTDELKYLTWTNEEVNIMNRKVREKIYTKPKKIELGESLIFDSPYGMYFTSQEIKVDTLFVDDIEFAVVIQETPEFILHKIPIKCYIINGEQVDTWGDGNLEWKGIFIVHEDAENQLESLSKVLKYACGSKKLKYTTRNEFLNKFAQVKYNHALTVHKSQGSSYQQTIINVGDISSNPNQQEKQRLLYTAITRASKLLILYNV